MGDLARRRRTWFALAAGVVLAALPAPSLAIAPAAGGAFPVFLSVDINIGPGDQYDPHLSGDLVSYTSGTTLRYYDFATGIDTLIPPEAGTEDQLSDVAEGRIAFSRLDLGTFESEVLLFDVAAGTTTPVGAGSHQTNAAMGGATVAYVDLWTQELIAARLAVSVTQLTLDGRIDRQPDVAPSGDLIVWESCQLLASNCDVAQASWNGTSWQVTSLTTTGESEANPATDGTIVAYDADRGGARHIYWQPAGGGAEQALTIPGLQRNPSVSTGVLSFESVAVGETAADLYLYDTATNRLFQITSTPGNESLNDVDVLPDGRIRVVWSSGSEGERNVYGVTLELPPVGPTYSFGGFRSPVDARPTLNSVKAGAAVPVTFSLGGNEGLAIFATGYPRSDAMACDSTADVDAIEQTVAAGASSLTFDPSTGLYTYVWKTEKAWAGTCRQLVLAFENGTEARANFKLK